MLDNIINNVISNIKKTQLDSKSSIIFNQSENSEYSCETIIDEVTKRLGIPYINELAPQYSPNGYVGFHIIHLLIELLDKANGDIDLAQKGVILLNDINVLYELNASGIRTILTSELPELITGRSYNILYNGEIVTFDTTNVTVIGVGDFSKVSEEQMQSPLSINQGFRYLGGFQEIIDISNITLNRDSLSESETVKK